MSDQRAKRARFSNGDPRNLVYQDIAVIEARITKDVY